MEKGEEVSRGIGAEIDSREEREGQLNYQISLFRATCMRGAMGASTLNFEGSRVPQGWVLESGGSSSCYGFDDHAWIAAWKPA